MSIKSSKIRNNIFLLLMTVLLGSTVGLQEAYAESEASQSASEEPKSLTPKEQKELAAFKKMTAEKRDQLPRAKLEKFEDLKKAEKLRYNYESNRDAHLEAAKIKAKFTKDDLLSGPDKTSLAGTSYGDKDVYRIHGAARNAAKEAIQAEKDAEKPSKLKKLTSKISDIRERSGIPGSIKEARNNAKENFSNLKKGTTKAAKNVRDAAKSAHESISNKINPKISPEEAAKLEDEQNVKALNAHKEMADKANAKGAHEEMVRRANKDDVKKPTPLSTSETVQSTKSAGETKTASPKKQGFFSKIFGGSKPKPTVPTSDLDSAASKASKFEEAASFVERL